LGFDPPEINPALDQSGREIRHDVTRKTTKDAESAARLSGELAYHFVVYAVCVILFSNFIFGSNFRSGLGFDDFRQLSGKSARGVGDTTLMNEWERGLIFIAAVKCLLKVIVNGSGQSLVEGYICFYCGVLNCAPF